MAQENIALNPELPKLTQDDFERMMEDHIRYLLTKDNIRKPVQGKRASFRGYDLSDIDFRERNLSYVDFSYADISGKDFSVAVLQHADLSYAVVVGTKFVKSDLSMADLSWICAQHADFSASKLSYGEGTNGDFSYSKFATAFAPFFHAPNAIWDYSDVDGCKFHHGIYDGGSFQSVSGKFSEWDESHMSKIIVSDSDFSYSSCYGVNASHSKYYNNNLACSDFSYSDLSGWRSKGNYICGSIFRGNRLKHPPVSLGPFGIQNDFIAYNPQDDTFSLNPENYELPPSKESNSNQKAPYDQKKYRPVSSKELQKIVKRGSMLQAALQLVETYKKERSVNRSNSR